MRRTKADSDITRQRLLDAAVRIFSRDGYAAAKLDDIATLAGVTRGAIAHHFGGKAEVFRALIAERHGVVGETVDAAQAGGGGPLQTLRALLVGLLVRLETDDSYRMMNELMLFQRGGIPAEFAPALSTGSSYEDGIVQMLALGVQRGEVRADVDLRTAALAALGLAAGVGANWLLSTRETALSDLAEPVVDLFLAGIKPATPNQRSPS